jgi:hypothetical protein
MMEDSGSINCTSYTSSSIVKNDSMIKPLSNNARSILNSVNGLRFIKAGGPSTQTLGLFSN